MRSDCIGPKPVTAPGTVFDINTGGQFSCVCLEVKGTFEGALNIKGSLQGPDPVQMYTEDVSTGTSLGDGKITVAGLYRVASAAIVHVFVIADDDFEADENDPVSVYVTYSESLPPISIVGSV